MNESTAQIFRYQQRYIFFEMLSFCAILSICVLSTFPSVLSLLTYEEIRSPALRAGVYLNITALCVFLLFRIIKREIAAIEVGIKDDTLAIKSFNRITSINISDITGLSYIKTPLTKGYLRIKTTSGSINIPLYLENLIGFLSALHKNFEIAGVINQGIADTFIKLDRDAIIYQKSYLRSVNVYKPLFITSSILFITNLYIAGNLWGLAIIPMLLWAVTGLVLPTIIYFITDLKLNNIVRKGLDSSLIQPSTTPESEIILYSLYLAIPYFICGIATRIIFTWY